ncbi:MAG: type VII secretion target [Mycolicibacterium sp.]|uniref:type VII secretion target n=1 Tax=Mycolicibacterium sp. TaxID=2320850 RepID=UPI003D137809
MAIRVSSAVLREAAGRHQQAADYLGAVPSGHPEIASFLGSLGPVFGGFRAASLALLDQRRACYEQQARDHLHVTAGLREAAGRWEAHEDDAAARMRGLLDG